jgi:two-component system response regulator DesR
VRILLADDDPDVCSAIRLLLEDEPGMSVAADCATAEGLLEKVLCSRSDVVLVDWDLSGLRAGGELDRLRSAAPACQVVALSGRPEQRTEAMRSGAAKFVCKGDPPEGLLEVLRALR